MTEQAKNIYIDELFNNENDQELIKQYNGIKKDRKNAESNKKLLQNRVALLDQEFQRTIRKIEETRKKALEIYNLKLKNEQRIKKKEQDKEQQQKKSEEQEQIRKQQQKEHQLIIQKHQKQKLSNAAKVKAEKERNLKKIYSTQEATKQKLTLNNKIIRESRDLHRAREQLMQQKKDKIKEELQKKIEEEVQIKVTKQKEIETIENQEMELLSKLQNTQLLQKQAFDELESALTMTAHDFAEKFLKPQNRKAEDGADVSHYQSEDEINQSSKGSHKMSRIKSQPQFSENHQQNDSQNVSIEQIHQKDLEKSNPESEHQLQQQDEQQADQQQNSIKQSIEDPPNLMEESPVKKQEQEQQEI